MRANTPEAPTLKIPTKSCMIYDSEGYDIGTINFQIKISPSNIVAHTNVIMPRMINMCL